MEALILAGGYGTRLRPLTLKTPKELLPILSKPIIDYLLENLVRHGIRDAVFSVNNVFAGKLMEHVGDGSRWGLRKAEFIIEESHGEQGKLGAVGALDFVGARLKHDQDRLILGADNFSPFFDFGAMLESHRRSGCGITLALYREPHIDIVRACSVVEVLPDGRVVRFQEKPKDPVSDLISTAMYMVHPAFFRHHLPAYIAKKREQGVKPDNLGDIWEHLLAGGHFLNSYASSAFWMDVGKPQGYLLANEYMMGHIYKTKVVIDRSAILGGGVRTNGPVLVEGNARLGKNVVLNQYTHIMDGAEIGDGTVMENCLVFPEAVVKEGCVLKNCIVSEKAVVSAGSRIDCEHQIIGQPC